MAKLKKRKTRKAIARRKKEVDNLELAAAWRHIWVKAGILKDS